MQSELIDYLETDANVVGNETLCICIGTEFMAQFQPVGTRFQRNRTNEVIWATVTRLKLTEVRRLR